MGDFNIDLVKYTSDTKTEEFYNLLCSHNFRPLILQPTRVTSNTATLIDNIFINDISCLSTGGNITASISDHYFQFSHTNIFQNYKNKHIIKYKRDFRNFNKREFEEELTGINWIDALNENDGTDICYNIFFRKIESLFDEMAPYRKMTKKDVKLDQMPWITRGILVSMAVRDKKYKLYKSEQNLKQKDELLQLYKRYRNLIVILLRKSKQNYYSAFFIENQSNMKKTWDGIRNIINISKKKISPPTKLVYKHNLQTTDKEIAE